MAKPKSDVTTTDDLTQDGVDGVDLSPTHDELVAGIEEHTDPDTNADVDAPKTVKVKSPSGAVTEVPESILDALLDSGYSKSK